jgi:nitrate/nitrite-specific signal transduction histidine kinase
MAKTEHNLKAAEEFVRETLAKNFRQNVDAARLRAAAEKLCDALPERRAA